MGLCSSEANRGVEVAFCAKVQNPIVLSLFSSVANPRRLSVAHSVGRDMRWLVVENGCRPRCSRQWRSELALRLSQIGIPPLLLCRRCDALPWLSGHARRCKAAASRAIEGGSARCSGCEAGLVGGIAVVMGECEGSAAAGPRVLVCAAPTPQYNPQCPGSQPGWAGGFGRNARLARPVCGGTEGDPPPGLSPAIGPRAGALSRPGTRPSLREMTVRPQPTTLDSLGGKTQRYCAWSAFLPQEEEKRGHSA